MSVPPIPPDRPCLSPYLIVKDAPALIQFLQASFDGELLHRSDGPGGRVMHAQVRVGDSTVMLSEAQPEWPESATHLHLYVEDVDATYHRALKHGGTSVQVVEDQFYGDRTGGVKDPCGNTWWVASVIENVSEEEMFKRIEAMGQQSAE